jgi:ferritin
MEKKLETAFNDQINKEYYSAYLYLAMKTAFAEMNLPGFVNWFDIQVQEEKAHAVGMYNYVLERGGHVELEAIDKPQLEGTTPVEIFKQVLAHEKYVTSRINAVYDVAEEVKDRAAMLFLNWYIKEQVEEEASASDVLTRVERLGNDTHALLDLDKELATRVFNPPIIK